jgi:hypothetical protein
MLFGNMQFSVSQFLKTGSLNSANAVSIFFGNFTVALDVVAGHQREWRKPAYASDLHKGRSPLWDPMYDIGSAIDVNSNTLKR